MSLFLGIFAGNIRTKARVQAQRPIFYCPQNKTNEADIYIDIYLPQHLAVVSFIAMDLRLFSAVANCVVFSHVFYSMTASL